MTTVKNAEEDVPLIPGSGNKELFDYVATLFRQGKHTQEEIEELAQEFNQERCAAPAPEKKITNMVSRVSESNKPKKSDTYRLWYFPNLAKDDLQNKVKQTTYSELGTISELGTNSTKARRSIFSASV